MVKISSGAASPKGRISAQTRTSKRVGRLRQQGRRTTVQVRKKLKRNRIKNNRGFWLW